MTTIGHPLPTRVGIFGGTFDPIHHGHLAAASEAASVLRLDEVIFVPTGRPWHKRSRSVTDAEDRYRMTEMATAEDPRFSVSRVDIDRPGATYTVDTLRDLRRQRPEVTKWYLLTGADTLATVPSWKDAAELAGLTTFVGLTRPGHELSGPPLLDAAVRLVAMPALELSSGDCRDRVRRGAPLTYLVPAAVERFIAEKGLYRKDPPGRG